MGRGQAIALSLTFLGIAAGTLALALATPWFLPVGSEHGAGVDATIRYILAVAGVIFLLGHGLLAVFIWKYAGTGPAPYRPLSARAEWTWALIPVLAMTVASEIGVLVVGAPAWSQVYGPAPADALAIEVCGKQFEWIVRYPGKDGRFGRHEAAFVHDVRNPLGLDERDAAAVDDVVVRGALHVPAGRPIVVRLRSHDVLHSFSIPGFRVKQDVVPGSVQRTRFRALSPGRYEIACAELCGLGHYKMNAVLVVETPEEFARWLGAQVGWFE